MDPWLQGLRTLGAGGVGWIIVGGALVVAGFAYLAIKLVLLLAQLILFVATAALRALARIID